MMLNAKVAASPRITIGKPSTMQMLKMLLPTMLPIAMLFSPFFAATTVVTNSGRDVPIEMIVTDIIFWLMPMLSARVATFLTTNSLPRIIPPKPNIIINNDMGTLNFGLVLSSSSFLFVSTVIK